MYVCAHKFLSWPAGQDCRNEQNVSVKDKQEADGLEKGVKDGN